MSFILYIATELSFTQSNVWQKLKRNLDLEVQMGDNWKARIQKTVKITTDFAH